MHKTFSWLLVLYNNETKAYENYLSDMMKQSLFDQLRIQSTFSAIQWRNDILNYFVNCFSYFMKYDVGV